MRKDVALGGPENKILYSNPINGNFDAIFGEKISAPNCD